MAITAVVFDVGESLVGETRAWERIADVYSEKPSPEFFARVATERIESLDELVAVFA